MKGTKPTDAKNHVQILPWSIKKPNPEVERFLARPAFPAEAEAAAAEVLADVRTRGERAVLAAAKKFDGASLKPSELRVSAAEISAATKRVPAHVKRAVQEAYWRVMEFAWEGLREPWYMQTPNGGYTGEFFSPMDRVGVYVPGGLRRWHPPP